MNITLKADMIGDISVVAILDMDGNKMILDMDQYGDPVEGVRDMRLEISLYPGCFNCYSREQLDGVILTLQNLRVLLTSQKDEEGRVNLGPSKDV